MARGVPVSYDMRYKVEFAAPIRGHHIYKETWCPKVGEELVCRKDDREEAIQYDRNAIGVFQSTSNDKSEQLVGHIPIEISQLTNYFLEAATTNAIVAVVTGKRKREIGLVIPAKYIAYTENQKHAQIFKEKLLEKETILELAVHNELLVKMPRIF